jgi:hypothetical protein
MRRKERKTKRKKRRPLTKENLKPLMDGVLFR